MTSALMTGAHPHSVDSLLSSKSPLPPCGPHSSFIPDSADSSPDSPGNPAGAAGSGRLVRCAATHMEACPSVPHMWSLPPHLPACRGGGQRLTGTHSTAVYITQSPIPGTLFLDARADPSAQAALPDPHPCPPCALAHAARSALAPAASPLRGTDGKWSGGGAPVQRSASHSPPPGPCALSSGSKDAKLQRSKAQKIRSSENTKPQRSEAPKLQSSKSYKAPKATKLQRYKAPE